MKLRALWLLPLALLFACEAQQGAATSQASGGQIAASGPGAGTQSRGSQRQALPTVVYPEDLLVEIDRMVELQDASGALQQMHELLRADGNGNMELQILDVAANPQAPAQTPTPAISDRYLAQQRYYLRYRDLHLGAPAAVFQNYTLLEESGLVQIAGLDCEHYTLRSRQGVGDAELFVAAQSRLLLGWTLFDPAGGVVARMTAHAVNFAPSLNGVSWSAALVSEQPYSGPADDHLLTLPPLAPAYLPQGYYESEARILFTETMLSGFGNLLVQRYSDGVRQLFIAQHYRVPAGRMQPLALITEMRLSDLGGVRVAEGDPTQRRLYVVGDLPLSELHTIFGGLLPPA